MKITVLSPHRDDAAFSVGLAIQSWIAAGHTVTVINCFTRSRYSPFGDLQFVHANDLQSYVTALRQREDLRWSRQYRPPVSLVDLNLRDAPQRLRCSVEEVCQISPRPDDAAMAKIRKALQHAGSDALLLPLGIGDHVDHLTARLAAEEPWPGALAVAFYEDLPYAARPGGADGIELRVEGLPVELSPCFARAAMAEDEAEQTKRGLALCYDSQIDSEVTEQIARFCRRYHGRERLWGNAAFLASHLGVAD